MNKKHMNRFSQKKYRWGWMIGVVIFFIFLGVGNRSEAQTLFPDGSLIRARGESAIYFVYHNYKRRILNMAVFNSYGLNMARVQEIAPEQLALIPNTRVVKTVAASAVYEITTGKRAPIASAEIFLQAGFTFDEVHIVNQTELGQFPLQTSEVLRVPEPKSPVLQTLDTDDSVVVVPAILQKIDEARKKLHAAALLYPQEKLSAGLPRLAHGDVRVEVEVMQKKLQELGFFPATIAPNGVFGPATERAVKAFQAASGIEQTGTVGPQTAAALQKKGLEIPAAGLVMKQWRDALPAKRDVLLAVWKEATNDMQLVRIGIESKTVTTKTPGFTVRYRNGGGVNTQYTIVSPAGYQVLANRFPIFEESSDGFGVFPPQEVVYVPYNDAFRTPEIVANGREYLDDVVNLALADLEQKGVQSVSGRGLVSDLANAEEMKNIAIIEHIDPISFKKAADKQAVIDSVFTVLALNKNDAYRFSGSPKGALGLAQFIGSTYTSIRNRYPSAKLIPDFRAGMGDHVNAFEAMALYNDASTVALEKVVRERITSDPTELEKVMSEVRAAAYNGGAPRVKRALQNFGTDWQVAQSRSYGIFEETKQYVQKFKLVQLLVLL
ncbi:MAG: peptidoglycan-binding protein [bacterium]|nr:peptidoglycan-binding protein [bacterium]